MHKVSKAQARAAQNCANKSKEKGKEVEAFGKEVEASVDRVTEAQGTSIEVAGKEAQRHAIASYAHAQAAEATGSQHELNQAGAEHAKETNEEMKAVKVYGEIVQNQSCQTL
jgi:hypothetical protein